MMDIGLGEIAGAIEALGDGKHGMREIENQIVKNRHQKAIDEKVARTKARNKKK